MQPTYFKEVSLEGRDHDRGVPVHLGEWVPRTGRLGRMLGRDYVVADRPTMTTGFGEWPCRLYQVEIPAGEWPQVEPNVFRVPTYRPVSEMESWEVFGPQGRDVAALLDRAGTLTVDEVIQLASGAADAWRPENSAARRAAARLSDWADSTVRHGAVMAATGASKPAVLHSRDLAAKAGALALETMVVALMKIDDPRLAYPHTTNPMEVADICYERALDVVFFAAIGHIFRDVVTGPDFEALAGRWHDLLGEPSAGMAARTDGRSFDVGVTFGLDQLEDYLHSLGGGIGLHFDSEGSPDGQAPWILLRFGRDLLTTSGPRLHVDEEHLATLGWEVLRVDPEGVAGYQGPSMALEQRRPPADDAAAYARTLVPILASLLGSQAVLRVRG